MTATRISTIHKIGLTLGLALSMSTVATLSSFAYSARVRQMCMGDAFRLCSSEIPNIGRIVACIKQTARNSIAKSASGHFGTSSQRRSEPAVITGHCRRRGSRD
jgi:hypothetical protein